MYGDGIANRLSGDFYQNSRVFAAQPESDERAKNLDRPEPRRA